MTRSTAFLSLAMVPALIGVLALGAAPALAWDSETIGDNGDPADRYDIVFLGDGYRASEMSKFRADTDAVVAYLTGTVNPFKDYRRCFNFHRVLVESVESGVDHPAQGINPRSTSPCKTALCWRCIGLGISVSHPAPWARVVPGTTDPGKPCACSACSTQSARMTIFCCRPCSG
jgi:hypothetical protein